MGRGSEDKRVDIKQEAQRATYRVPEYNVPPFYRSTRGPFLFTDRPKNTHSVEEVKILLPVKFRWIYFSSFRGEVENVSANQRPGGHLVFRSARKKNLVEDVEILLPVKFRWIYFSSFRGEVENVSANQILFSARPAGQPSCISDQPEFFGSVRKNMNFVEDIKILFPVKFHGIPFSGFRGEVENVFANLWWEQPFCFPDRPEKHNLVEDVEILLPVKFHWILFSCFRGEVENVES